MVEGKSLEIVCVEEIEVNSKIFLPHYVGKRKGVQATQGDSSNFECV
jgi:hypothetical protein